MTDTGQGVPNPGSREAGDRGCTCPVLDNCHGHGFPINGETCFWITAGCPLHDTAASPEPPAPEKGRTETRDARAALPQETSTMVEATAGIHPHQEEV